MEEHIEPTDKELAKIAGVGNATTIFRAEQVKKVAQEMTAAQLLLLLQAKLLAMLLTLRQHPQISAQQIQGRQVIQQHYRHHHH